MRRGEALALQTWGTGKNLRCTESKYVVHSEADFRAGTFLGGGGFFFPRDEIWRFEICATSVFSFSDRATHSSETGWTRLLAGS